MTTVKLKGVVLRRVNVGDNDVILTVLSDTLGIISVSAKGVKSLRHKSLAGTALFALSDFVVRTGSRMYSLVSAELTESFYNLATNIERLAYATYIADITSFSLREGDAPPELLPLALNTFYLLANSQNDLRPLKCVFELKLLYYLGEAPEMNGCIHCGANAGLDFFTNEGGLLCNDCRGKSLHSVKISDDCARAMRYILHSEDKRSFFFKISDRTLCELEDITEGYFAWQADRSFYSLDYLHNILGKRK